MKPSRFTEEQIIGILRDQEVGAKTADVCRKHGISSIVLRCTPNASTDEMFRRRQCDGTLIVPNSNPPPPPRDEC
jgi:hypothetical protein